MEFYRFSLAWSRIMTDGTKDTINEPGIQYYNNLIDLLLDNNIEPMVGYILCYYWIKFQTFTLCSAIIIVVYQLVNLWIFCR